MRAVAIIAACLAAASVVSAAPPVRRRPSSTFAPVLPPVQTAAATPTPAGDIAPVPTELPVATGAASAQQVLENPATAAAPINAPQVVITDADAASVAPRQVILDTILSAAQVEYAQHAQVLGAPQASDTLAALVSAYDAYTGSGPQAAAVGAGDAATTLYTAVLAHVATPQGAQMVQVTSPLPTPPTPLLTMQLPSTVPTSVHSCKPTLAARSAPSAR